MTLLEEYRLLLAAIDDWFSRCQAAFPEEIACGEGCSECCRGLFDITVLDAALLKSGFDGLPEDVKAAISVKAEGQVVTIRSLWPEFSHPFTINHRSEEEVEELLASDNDTPCLLLDDNGRCRLYEYRPMTCRLHGLPLIDVSAEVMESEWCTKNFTDIDPLELESLRGGFKELFYKEAAMGRCFTTELLGRAVGELDTFIPTALLIDFTGFDWRKWYSEHEPAHADVQQDPHP